jgi:hypothetical protein
MSEGNWLFQGKTQYLLSVVKKLRFQNTCFEKLVFVTVKLVFPVISTFYDETSVIIL